MRRISAERAAERAHYALKGVYGEWGKDTALDSPPPFYSGDQLLLPTTAQGLIELNEGEQFVASRLSQVQLGGKQIAIGVEGVELRIHAALISQIGEARPVL